MHAANQTLAWVSTFRSRRCGSKGDATARSWIEECVHCQLSRGSVLGDSFPVLPTRVIDAGPHDGFTEPRLVGTVNIRGTYIALSYCWGTTQTLTTTTATLAGRMAGISLSACPPTIQDAILACRELRCCYLWVDALCIIQDCDTDWEDEAARMGEVHKSAWVTIVAESAENTECGFFRGRPMYGRSEDSA